MSMNGIATTENTSPMLDFQVQESKREIRLIGNQIDGIFLRDSPPPQLPEWLTSESASFLEPSDGTVGLRRSESDLDQDVSRSNGKRGKVPAESTGDGNRDESAVGRLELEKLAQRIEDLRRKLEQI